MSTEPTKPKTDGFSELVRQSRQQMQLARNHYWREKTSGNGGVSWGVRELLARRLVQYYDILWEYKEDKQSVEQAWEESEVDMIESLANETRSVPSEAPGDTSNTQKTQKPALAALPPEKLVELSKQLDSLANGLGFAASVERDREFGQIGGEDLWDE
jgi:hypothetical protein